MRLHTQQVASQRAAKDYRLEAATTMEVTDSRGDRESDYEESSSYYRPSSSSTTTFAHGDLFKFDPCSGDEAKGNVYRLTYIGKRIQDSFIHSLFRL